MAAASDAKNRERYRRLSLDGARVDERGFFQIAGIKPGAYTLLARHPASAPTRADGLEIGADEELELESLLLEEPARLEVEIYPRLSPFSRPWTLRLTDPDGDPHARPWGLPGLLRPRAPRIPRHGAGPHG